MLFDYLKISTRLVRIYFLVNSEHGIKDSDLHVL
jgi:hypothetical protein